MLQPEIDPRTGARGDARRAAILDAALVEFSAHGIDGASMNRIASGAGISRPGLYQYFANKQEILAAGFIAVFESHAHRAIDALGEPGSVEDRLNGFVQRFHGDLWELMAESEHIDEIFAVKTGAVADDVHHIVDALFADVDRWLGEQSPESGAKAKARRQGWVDMLRLAPIGLRSDGPSLGVYRGRLTTMASSVASDVQGCS